MDVFDPTIRIPTELVGLDAAIEHVRLNLANLPWLEKAFHRAYLMNEKISKEEVGADRRSFIQVPKVPVSKAEYFPVMPNDNLKSFSFFIGKDADTPTETTTPYERTSYMNKEVDLVFFLHLQKIDPAKDYIFTEELKRDVVEVLQRSPGNVITKIWTETVQQVYANFNIKLIERDLLYYPFAGMRFRLTMSYQYNQCL